MIPLFGALFALSASVSAAKMSAPIELYDQGRYEQAIDAGVHENTASGFAVAARAELASELMRPEPCLECLERAEAFARQSIAVDPKPAEGHIYLAVTIGYEARIIGPIAARFRRYAEKSRMEIDTALASEPKNAWAWAALGGWHVEIVHNGGKTLAKWLYGASVREGLADFQKSFALDPDNPVLWAQYALTLAAYDRETYRPEIAAALAKAIQIKPKTVYETVARSRAQALLAALNNGDFASFDSLVRRDQGYP